jgi:hypothetical protein
METFGNNLVAKSGKNMENIFFCEKCHYKCFKKYNWMKHLSTAKHLMEINKWQSGKKVANTYICDICDKFYITNAGLWKHKKKCDKINNDEPLETLSEIKLLTNLVLDVVNQNKELTKQNNDLTNKIVDICKTGHTNNNSFSINNSHNKTFNLHFFLNETCKDAMNIMDFVDSIKLQLSDLENVGKLGYVEGISNIITSNLNALDVTQRPIHCADKKREVIYIKDEDKWEKEDEEKRKIKKAIHRVVCKNQRLITNFKEEHPDCLKASSKFSDQYNKIIVESMGGSGDNDKEKEEKIIKNITKQVIIEKTN